MGLIKAAASAVGGTLHDQWKEYIRCEDLGNDILMKKVTTKNGIITKNSAIQVAPGQVAMIFQSGKVMDATAEPGIYTFDESTSPSFFAGDFGAVFKEMWTRFTYNGATAKEQAVFYFNAKEILDNKFGTPAPVPYTDWSHPIPNQMTGQMMPQSLEVKCFGTYTFKISDPSAFMSRIAGVAEEYKKETLVEQIQSEVISSFKGVINTLGNEENKIGVLSLPSADDKIKELMSENTYDKNIRERGVEILSFAIASVTLSDESKKKIDNYELGSNAYMQQGSLVGSFGRAMEGAANNPNGAVAGMMGVGMANMNTGGMMGGVMNNAFNGQGVTAQDLQNQNATAAPTTEAQGGAFCPNCGAKVDGAKFCPNCGNKLGE